jgi:hypothetical protein
MKLEDHVKFALQSKANKVLAVNYDGSGDMWHYVKVFDQGYDINVWDTESLGDGLDSLKITVYPSDEVTCTTNYDEYANLEVSPMALKVCKLRLKLEEITS